MHSIGIHQNLHDDIVIVDDVHVGRTPRKFAAEKPQSIITTSFKSPRDYSPRAKTPDGLGDVEKEVVLVDVRPADGYSLGASAPPLSKPKSKRAKKHE